MTPTPIPIPGLWLSKNFNVGSAFGLDPVKLNSYVYDYGNTPFDEFTLRHSLPAEFRLTSLSSGTFRQLPNLSAAVPASVTVRYRVNAHPVWYSFTWDNFTTTQVIDVADLDLPASSYITEVEYLFGSVEAGFYQLSPMVFEGYFLNPQGSSIQVYQECATLSGLFAGTSYTRTDCDNITIQKNELPIRAVSSFDGAGAPFAIGQQFSLALMLNNAGSRGRILENPIMANLLPEGVDYIAGSWRLDAAPAGSPQPRFRAIPNFRNSGRTLLRWSWEGAQSYNLAQGETFVIKFDNLVTNRMPYAPPVPNDYFALSSSNDTICYPPAGQITDTADIDQDQNTGEAVCHHTLQTWSLAQAQLTSRSMVRGELDPAYLLSPDLATSTPNGPIHYRYFVVNTGNVPMNQVMLVDLLPYFGDVYVTNPAERESAWSPILAAPISVPPGGTLWYTTTPDPCRPEVEYTAACNVADWKTDYYSISDPADIKAFKVIFPDVLQPGQELRFDFQMVLPSDVPTNGEIAWNSFAYSAEREDFGIRFSAEPSRAGVQAQPLLPGVLGDFVWLDADGNGLQDAGEEGVNNVRVLLYRNGNPVAFKQTITVNDINGRAGYYLFSNLPAGDYVIRVEKPIVYNFTLADAGSNDAIDSDADPTTGSTPVITLDGSEYDYNWDFGLVPNPDGAIGDYVWVDENANGVQDDPVGNGVNGVTVRLYADDGDGIREPGGDDTVYAVTQTASDIDNRPGYYLFNEITPGDYFVEFHSTAPFAEVNVGSDDTVDSDADTAIDGDPNTGHSEIVTINAAEYNATIDAGLLTFPVAADEGDAPDSYGLASHAILDGLHLGQLVDPEDDPFYSFDALGDDLDNLDDEDGVAFNAYGEIGSLQTVEITVENTLDRVAFVDAWVDFNLDGLFDPATEQVVSNLPFAPNSAPTSQVVTYPIPNDALCGDTFARFRLSRSGSLDPTTPANRSAPEGEVEDYQIRVACLTDVMVTKSAAQPNIGLEETITWQIGFTNKGPEIAQTATLTDTLPPNTAYEGFRIISGSGWSCSVNATDLVCTKAAMAVDELLSLELYTRVPARYVPDKVVNTVIVTSDAVDLNPDDNTATAEVVVEKEWIAAQAPPADTYAHLIYSGDIRSSAGERDLKTNYAYNPLQVPLLFAYGLDATEQPTMTVRGCLNAPSPATCNSESVIEGYYLVESYEVTAVQYLEDNITPIGVFTNTAPVTSTVTLNRVADRTNLSGKCVAASSCLGFDRFDQPAYQWRNPDDFFQLVTTTRGGRDVGCLAPLAGSDRCITIQNGKPGIYVVRGQVTVRLVFEDPILNAAGVFISDPVAFSAALYVEQYAPFVEPNR